ncbi:FHIPEP family type III secretion protein [Blastopirellula marina]|uniref:Flagellar biosynthesis protein FlhA n=1 Tax=Blastopirellula marina TaxID=124 RepID=A0A2S8FMX0_9BACT|nr:FHIPEP family type III secretion protein [Blastopirellula marina]PQO33552.1 hypothetical protein C5Y98_15025 [Blastopirellula marina]PTL43339.1 hypothetical protein C5Y97_15035 [Blastopirellula marina]
MDYASILARYIGREVYVSTFGHVRLRGELAAIYEDCVRLVNASTSQETEDTPWSNSWRDDADGVNYADGSEALVHFHHIVAIRCADDELLDIPILPQTAEPSVIETVASPPSAEQSIEAEPWEPFLEIDRLTLEMGSGLIRLVHPDSNELMQRVSAVRCHLADTLGLVVPRMRLRDALDLEDQEYRILIDQCEVARGRLGPGQYIALDMGTSSGTLQGVRGVDPTFGGPGIWITADRQQEAEQLGYLVIDPSMLVVTHMQETLRRHAHEILTLSDVRDLLERLRETSPCDFEEIRSSPMTASLLHAVLRRLLEEGVSIKNFSRIVEILALHGHRNQEIETLVALVRVRLGRQLVQRYLAADGKVHAIGLDRELESLLQQLTEEEATRQTRNWIERMVDVLRESFQRLENQQRPVALVVSSPLRNRLWQILSPHFPQVSVLSLAEVPRNTEIYWQAILSAEEVGALEPAIKRGQHPAVAKDGAYRAKGKVSEHLADELPPRRPR